MQPASHPSVPPPAQPLAPRALEAQLDEIAVLIEMEYLRLPFAEPRRQEAPAEPREEAAEAAPEPDEAALRWYVYLTVDEGGRPPVAVLLTTADPGEMEARRAAEEAARLAELDAMAQEMVEKPAEPFDRVRRLRL